MAPEVKRSKVKLAASISVSFSANRQSIELPAKATIAERVSNAVKVFDGDATLKVVMLDLQATVTGQCRSGQYKLDRPEARFTC